ncbi:hypothetical protein F2Q70_00011164 [Brassica cretica]|uniref:Uncharacterized protein n=1 Tax=Brassica cretica TaxID=69181 RepID=A0A8S9LU30_BRACR|nr:hypothetical protein F2Q70_00011164 [Brassica cretica]
MLERLSTAVEFWLVLESRHGGTELLCPVESAFQGCGSQSFVISVLGGGKWRHDPWLGCDVSYLCLEVSTGRTDHGLAQSNSFWAGYGRAQLINGSTGQKTNWSLEPSRSKCVDEVSDSYKFRRDYRKLATLETTWEFPASEAMRRTPPSYGLVDGRKRPLIPKDSKY